MAISGLSGLGYRKDHFVLPFDHRSSFENGLLGIGDRLLVEFRTPGRNLLGRRRTYRTIEWVTPHEPHAIEFEGVEGPLSMLCDRFDLTDEGGCTRLTYECEFGLKGWVLGWLVSRMFVRRMLRRMMHEHLEEMKETIEARAVRSKAFPRRPCSPMDARGEFGHVDHADRR